VATTASLVIVTRPAPTGSALCERLQGDGRRALWLPAFRLAPAPDPTRVAQTLSRLTDFDLAVFVSSSAVRAIGSVLKHDWPAAVAIGAVGDATLHAVETELSGAASATLIAPAPESDEGSEGFWSAWVARGVPARRVLILRAQTGREWLAETFTAAGAAVESVAVYRREVAELDEPRRTAIESAMALGQVAWTLYSSTEAVDALDRQVADVSGASAWLRRGIALATHPRIAQRLQAVGFTKVAVVSTDDDALLSKLESLQAEL